MARQNKSSSQTQQQLTLDQAYQATYLWLDVCGQPPLEISEPAHGSVELITDQMFVRVRSSERPVEQSSVLALLRAAESGKKLVMFSPSGFSAGALSIAETQGIALYTLDTTGRAVHETTHARALAPEVEPDPPFSPDTPEEWEDDFWSDIKSDETSETPDGKEPPIQAAADDWADCPKCGTTHYRNARFCRECGTDLSSVGHGHTDQESSGPRLRCRACGSLDIESLDSPTT